MPDEKDPSKDDCWSIRKPVIYKVRGHLPCVQVQQLPTGNKRWHAVVSINTRRYTVGKIASVLVFADVMHLAYPGLPIRLRVCFPPCSSAHMAMLVPPSLILGMSRP
jgi:hypothetical protein